MTNEATETETKAPKGTTKSKKNGSEPAAERKSLFGHVASGKAEGEFRVPLSKIVFPDFDSRAGEKPLDVGFVESIKRTNGPQTPVLLAKIKDSDMYMVVAGRRRCRAAKELKLKDVKASVLAVEFANEKDAESYLAETAINENLQREQINDWDAAVTFKRLIDDGWDQESIAAHISKGVPYVSQHLSIMKLDPRTQNLCKVHSNDPGMFSKARELCRVPDPDSQFEIAKDAFSKEKGWSSVDVKEVVEKFKAKEAARAEREASKSDKPKKTRAAGSSKDEGDEEEEEKPSPYAEAKIAVGVREARALCDLYDAKLSRARERDASPEKVAYLKGCQDTAKTFMGMKALPKTLDEE